jgi:hypothetical protein
LEFDQYLLVFQIKDENRTAIALPVTKAVVTSGGWYFQESEMNKFQAILYIVVGLGLAGFGFAISGQAESFKIWLAMPLLMVLFGSVHLFRHRRKPN